jgi:sodium/potassium-transporting ATPase subunit alpha
MDMVPRQAKVIREGQLKESPAAELVPGDIVFVRLGDKVPADVRLFWAQDLKVCLEYNPLFFFNNYIF